MTNLPRHHERDSTLKGAPGSSNILPEWRASETQRFISDKA
jgi:hypothetical protein